MYDKVSFLNFASIYLADNKQCNFTNKDSCYKEPLHYACQNGSIHCVKWLIDNVKNLNLDSLKKGDWTPLMLTVVCKSVEEPVIMEIIKIFIDKKCNLQIKNKDGWTAFHLSCRTSNIDVVQQLGSASPICCNYPSNNGRTPLHTACLHGNIEIVQYLVKKFYSTVNIFDNCGITPLMDSFIGCHVNVSKWLLESSDAKMELFDKIGRHVIHVSCESGQLDSVKFILNKFPELLECQTLYENKTPLLSAAKRKHHEIVEFLLSIGANKSSCDNQGRTFEVFL